MFQGNRVTLRAPELSDIPDTVRYFNDLEVRRNLNHLAPVAVETQKEWIQRITKLRREGSQFTFVIELLKPCKFLGMCALTQISSINRSASLGIAISNKAYWNQGLGTEAMEILLQFGFETLNLHRIHLTVYEYNHIAKRLYDKLGFMETGRIRHSILRFGNFYDMYTMDLLEDEYRAK